MESPCECGIERPGSISHGVNFNRLVNDNAVFSLVKRSWVRLPSLVRGSSLVGNHSMAVSDWLLLCFNVLLFLLCNVWSLEESAASADNRLLHYIPSVYIKGKCSSFDDI